MGEGEKGRRRGRTLEGADEVDVVGAAGEETGGAEVGGRADALEYHAHRGEGQRVRVRASRPTKKNVKFNQMFITTNTSLSTHNE